MAQAAQGGARGAGAPAGAAAGATTPAPGAEAGKAANKGEDKKLLKSKDFYLKEGGDARYEQLARQKRDEAILRLKEILDSGNIEGDDKAEMYFRLASLHTESANDLFLQEMSEYTTKYDAWFASPNSAKTPSPVEDHARSKAENLKAVELYKEILKSHRGYPRLAEVYFNLAFAMMDLGNKTEALDYYNTLVKGYPQSEYVPDTYLALGEYWFENNNAFKALQYYKKAATYAQSRVYIFALYKLGWCLYNVGETAQAIETMKSVIVKSGDGAEGNKISLKDEALNDLVLFYSEAGDMNAAEAYFATQKDPKYFKAMLKRLASTYLEQGRNDLAITTFQRLISAEPDAKDAPSFQGEIINTYFKWNRKQETLAEIDRLALTYGTGSRWAQLNAANKDAINEANGLIERNLRSVAIDYHKDARKTSSPSSYQAAKVSYEKYLKMFPKNQYSYDMRFAYAEVLYELRQYEKAADEYEAVIQIDPKGKYFQLSANSLILTINKILGLTKPEDDGTTQQVTTTAGAKDRDIKPVALNPWETRKVKICDLYAESLPEDKDSPVTLYEGARLMYDKNQFNESTTRFLKLISRYPKEEVAEVAANLVLDSYNVLGDFVKVEQYARQFAGTLAFKEPFRKEARDIYEKAAFKKVEPLEKENKHAEALAAYTAFYNEFKAASTLSDRALFNAAFHAFKLGDIPKSVALRYELDKVFPKSSLALKNLDALGKALESIADYGRAAEAYEKLVASDLDKSFPGSADALYNAALFRDALGQWQQAIANYEAYALNFKDRDDSHLVILEVAKIYEANGKLVEAMATYKRYFTTPALASKSGDAEFEARIRYGRLLRAQGQKAAAHTFFQESSAAFERLVKSGATLEVAPLYHAEMRFFMVEPQWERFVAIRLDLVKTKKGSRASSLEDKLKSTEEVVGAYTAVLELKQGEWGIAALCKIGQAYANLADTILSAPLPPELTEEQQKIYRAALEDRAFPLRDKAAEALEQALLKSYELGIYNTFTAEASAMMAVLRPKEYPAQAERLGVAEALSDTFFSADFMK